MKYDVITMGGATEDINFFTDDGVLIDNKEDILKQRLLAFEFGAKIKIKNSHSTFGGGAANSAVSFSRLGFKTACLAAVGEDERGKKIIANLKKHGVKTELVQKIKNMETGYSFVLVGPKNEHIVFSDRGANNELQIGKQEIAALKQSKFVYITSLSGKWETVLKNIFSLKDQKIAWNPGHIQLNAGMRKLAPFIKRTFILCLNKDEAIELCSSDPKNIGQKKEWFFEVKNLLKSLKECGPNIVVITSGKDGADAYDGNDYYHQDILKEKKRVDTTGVGDAFNSTFVGIYDLINDPRKSLKAGAKNTASVIGLPGAQNGLLKLAEIKKAI